MDALPVQFSQFASVKIIEKHVIYNIGSNSKLTVIAVYLPELFYIFI